MTESKYRLGNRIASAMGLLFVGVSLSKALNAICIITLARILGPEAFGRFGIVQSTVLAFATYGGFRMGNTAVKHVAQYRERDSAKAARILRLALLVSAVLLGGISILVAALSSYLAENTLKAPGLRTGLLIGTAYLFFASYGSIVQQSLSGFEDFGSVSKNGILSGFLMLVFCIPLAKVWGLEGALAGLALAAGGVLPQAFRFLKRQQLKFSFPASITMREAFAEWPVLLHFALPGFLVLATMTGTNWLVRVLLTRHRGFAELGLFEAAGQWVAIIYFIPGLLARVAMPMLAASEGADDHSIYRQTFSLQIRAILMLTGPATVLLLGLGRWVALLYGARYYGTENIMPLLFTAGFFRTINESCRLVYESKGRQWSALCVYVVWSVVFLGCAWVLVPMYGAVGLGVAVVVAEFALTILSATQVQICMVPGGLTPNAGLLVQMTLWIMLAYLANLKLNPSWSTIICVILGLFAIAPALRHLHGSQIHRTMLQQLARFSHQ